MYYPLNTTEQTASSSCTESKRNEPKNKTEKKNAAVPKSLSQKLQYVARDVPQLVDAIFALNAWTTKAASRGDLERYFLDIDAQKSVGGDGNKEKKEEGPLLTIIQRVLLFQPSQQNKQQADPSTLIAGCANLITSVLLSSACNVNVASSNSSNVSNGVAHSSSMKKALGELLRRGRGCASLIDSIEHKDDDKANVATSEEVALMIATSIIELLQRAAEEKRAHEQSVNTNSGASRSAAGADVSILSFSSETQAEQLVRQVEREISALSKSANGQGSQQAPQQRLRKPAPGNKNGGQAVIDMITRRDRNKQIAEKSGVVVEISVGCKKQFAGGDEGEEEKAQANVTGGNGSKEKQRHQLNGKYQSTEGRDVLAQKIVGASLHGFISKTTDEVKSLETKIETIVNESSTEKGNLAVRKDEISTKRQDISKRMEQLRRELEELERQNDQLAKEEDDVSAELERLERKSEKEVIGLKSKISAKSDWSTLHREVARTVEMMGELEMAWIRSSSVAVLSSNDATRKKEDPSLAALLPNKFDQYLNRARAYFQSESQCVELLRNRISSAEAEVLDLEREIQECTMLGMEANVGTMTHKLGTLKSFVDEDNAVIDSLRRDAKAMREDLIRRVEEYCALMQEKDTADNNGVDGTPLKTTHVAALEGISIELTGIGFYDDEDGGLGGIFAKIPQRVTATKQSVLSGESVPDGVEISNNDASISFIGDVDTDDASSNGTSNAKSALPPRPLEKVTMPKFSWASKANTVPKETKSLLEIQKEELSAKKEAPE